MVLRRSHLPWAFFVLIASAASGVLYLANFHPGLLPFPLKLPAQFGPVPPLRDTIGGTPLGLVFGTLALLIFLFAAALGIRKKRRTWPIGHVQFWLKAHIWLTILTIPLVLFHCGFKAGGPMTTVLLVLYAIVMGSGFFGLALQQFMPRMMSERVPREVVYEQIPHMRRQLVKAAEGLRKELLPMGQSTRATSRAGAIAAGRGGAATLAAPTVVEEDRSEQVLLEFLDDECLRYLRAGRGRTHRLGDQNVSDDVFRVLKLSVAERLHSKVDDMQSWCDDRRQMGLQKKLHGWLHGWLLIHVPISFALLVMTLWHAWVAITYL